MASTQESGSDRYQLRRISTEKPPGAARSDSSTSMFSLIVTLRSSGTHFRILILNHGETECQGFSIVRNNRGQFSL